MMSWMEWTTTGLSIGAILLYSNLLFELTNPIYLTSEHLL